MPISSIYFLNLDFGFNDKNSKLFSMSNCLLVSGKPNPVKNLITQQQKSEQNNKLKCPSN